MFWGTLRRFILGCLIIIGPCGLLTSVQAYEGELQTLSAKLVSQLEAAGQKSGTVLDFTDLQGTPNELGRFLAQELSNQLVSTSTQMSFVDRANLQTLLRENKLSMEGLINPESSKKLGNLIGIDTLIFGTTTPLGDKIRLSVRAIAVETGKIIASQSTTLPTGGGLAELYTRGVANQSANSIGTEQVKPADPRDRLRGDSFRLTGKEVVVSACYNGSCPSATLMLENLSGMGLEASIARGSISIGSCIVPPQNANTSGLTVTGLDGKLFNSPSTAWRYLPTGSKMNLAISTQQCDPALLTNKTADVAFALVVKVGDQIFSVPMSATGVPVRSIK